MVNCQIIFSPRNTIVKSYYNNIQANSTKNGFFIEGGGTRGIYAIGILKYLFEKNPYFNLTDVHIFGGTSVGSFLSTALSLGFDKDDMVNIIKDIDFGNLIDSKFLFMITLCRFLKQGYLYDDEGRQNIIHLILNYKIDIIKKHLDDPTVNSKNLTFGHLKILINLYPHIYKHLIINAVDINRGEQIFMCTLDNKFDDIAIFDAIMASSAIPLVFKPLELYYYPDLKLYGYTPSDNATRNCLVDGGLDTNNPLDYFLINKNLCSDYNFWLLKFTNPISHVDIDGIIPSFSRILEYVISIKNNIKTTLIKEKYSINIFNLHLNVGALDIYTSSQIQKIISDIYNKCVSQEIHIENDDN